MQSFKSFLAEAEKAWKNGNHQYTHRMPFKNSGGGDVHAVVDLKQTGKKSTKTRSHEVTWNVKNSNKWHEGQELGAKNTAHVLRHVNKVVSHDMKTHKRSAYHFNGYSETHDRIYSRTVKKMADKHPDYTHHRRKDKHGSVVHMLIHKDADKDTSKIE